MPQKTHATGGNPFDNKNISCLIETGIMGVNELAGLPLRTITTDRERSIAEDLPSPFGVIAQMRDDGVGPVK